MSKLKTFWWLPLAVLAVAGAGTVAAFQLQPPPVGDLLVEASTAMGQTPAIRLKGHEVVNDQQVTIDGTLNHSGDFAGTVVMEDLNAQVLESHDEFYFRSDSFPSSFGPNASVFNGRWVMVTDDPAAQALKQLLHLPLPGAVKGHGPRISSLPSTVIDGKPAVRLQADTGELVYLTTSRPSRVIRVATSGDRTVTQGSKIIKNVLIDVSYPKPAKVTPPSDYIDPLHPETLPARWSATSVTMDGCDRTGCTVTAVLKNLGGAAVTPSTATARLQSAAGADLGSCSVQVPTDQPLELTRQVSCRVTSPEWVSFALYTGGSYHASVRLKNPSYPTDQG